MRPFSRDEFAIAIICALTLEAEAVEDLFDETYDRLGEYYGKQPRDDNAYVNGRIGKHNVVLCYMPGMGKGSAASVASSLKISYKRIEVALVVGICGGAPYPSSGGEIFLGDVIISDSVVQYDFGRQYPCGYEKKTAIRSKLAGLKARRSRKDFQEKLSRHLQALQESSPGWLCPSVDDVLYEASYQHKHYDLGSTCICLDSASEDTCKAAIDSSCTLLNCDLARVCRRRLHTEHTSPIVHIGTVASADTVMKSGEHRDRLAQLEGAVGFEMEGAGVWDNISCIIVKGVCDYADSHKNKAWQAYTAATGAAAAKSFLEYWEPTDQEVSKSHIPRNLSASDPEKSEKSHWTVPFRKNSGFVGRDIEIAKVEELFETPDGPFKVALCGLGGVGKTQIALELAYRVRRRDPTCSIFWIQCTSNASVEQAFLGITQSIGLQEVKPSDAQERVKAYLSQVRSQKWLLIFDNGAGATELANFLPLNEQGRILFTTRNRKLAMRLSSPFTGMKILEKALQKKELLTFLPLAISQAAAYINCNDIEQESDVIELLSEDFGDDGRYQDIQNPQVQRSNLLAAEYLSFMACINPRDIPQSLLPEAPSRKKKIDAIGILKAFSFISEQVKDHALSLHRLQFSLQIRKTANRLNQVFPDNNHKNQKVWREYLPHALSLVNESYFQKERHNYTRLVQNVGRCLQSDGRYSKAAVLFKDIMELQRRERGPEHPGTLTSMNNLAYTLYSQQNTRQAIVLLEKCIRLRGRVLGPSHPATISSARALEEWRETRDSQPLPRSCTAGDSFKVHFWEPPSSFGFSAWFTCDTRA
ncbi:putative kinesin light chain [Aspergillus filifer]